MSETFSEGDFVKFETDSYNKKPRWMNNKDFGGSGEWAEGVITDINEYYFIVDSLFPDKSLKTVKFPNIKSTFYNPHQWQKEGYLQKCDIDWFAENKKTFAEKKCECGGDKAKTTHSTWCPKFESY